MQNKKNKKINFIPFWLDTGCKSRKLPSLMAEKEGGQPPGPSPPFPFPHLDLAFKTLVLFLMKEYTYGIISSVKTLPHRTLTLKTSILVSILS